MDRKKLYFRFSLVALWCLVIFMFSTQNASESSQTSGFFLMQIGNFIGIDLLSLPFIDVLQFIIRKGAHMFSYFVLGILSYRAFKLVQPLKAFRYAGLFTVLYACSDEFHQLFVPGRSGQMSDVLIDSLGMLIGFFLLFMIERYKRKRVKA